jgi:hypothetical protein
LATRPRLVVNNTAPTLQVTGGTDRALSLAA